MSDPSASRAYLRSAFEFDPGREAGSIFELRRAYRGTETSEKKSSPSRERIQTWITRIREHFYTATPGQLRKELERIDAEDHPDLNRHLNRLRRVADLREEILLASGDEYVDDGFMEIYRECAIARRREAVRLQTECLERMETKAWHQTCNRSAGRIERHHPALLELMPQWFEQIRKKPKPSLGASRGSRSALGCLGVYIVVRIVVTIIKNLIGDESP